MKHLISLLPVIALLSGCSATVPLAPMAEDVEAKTFRVMPGKSNIYVVRRPTYAAKLHDVAIDGGQRISLTANTFIVFSVDPGRHIVTLYSTENRVNLRVVTQEGKSYFVKMGWKIGSGQGDVRVTGGLVSESKGRKYIKEARLVSLDGY